MCKIPYSLDSVGNREVTQLQSLLTSESSVRRSQCHYSSKNLPAHPSSALRIPRIATPSSRGIYIEQTFQNKAAPLKRSIICERLSQISRSDNNKIMRFIKSQISCRSLYKDTSHYIHIPAVRIRRNCLNLDESETPLHSSSYSDHWKRSSRPRFQADLPRYR